MNYKIAETLSPTERYLYVQFESNSFTIIILFFWVCNFFGSTNYFKESVDLGLSFTLTAFFDKGLFGFFLSPKDLSLFLLFLWPLLKLKNGFYLHSEWMLIFSTTILVTVLMFINPNNRFDFLTSLFNNEVRNYYLFLFAVYVVLSMNPVSLTFFLYRIFKLGFITFIILTIASFINFIFFTGITLLNVKRVIVQHDLLLFYYYMTTILFTLYLVRRKRGYQLIIAFFFLTIILSYVRTSFWLSVSAITIIYILSMTKSKLIFMNTFLAISLIILVVVGILIFSSNMLIDTDMYIDRYLGAFSYFNSQSTTSTDQGHIEESLNTTQFFFNNLQIFWGNGINNDAFFVAGATAGNNIHNMYVYVWARYGIFFTIYLVGLLIFFIYKFFAYFGESVRDKVLSGNFFKASMALVLILYFFSSWSTSQVKTINSDLLSISQFSLLLGLLRIDNSVFQKLIFRNDKIYQRKSTGVSNNAGV